MFRCFSFLSSDIIPVHIFIFEFANDVSNEIGKFFRRRKLIASTFVAKLHDAYSQK